MKKYFKIINKVTDNKYTWEGNNYFFFKGRMLVGPTGFKPLLIVGALALYPTILFLCFTSDVIYN